MKFLFARNEIIMESFLLLCNTRTLDSMPEANNDLCSVSMAFAAPPLSLLAICNTLMKDSLRKY